MSVKSGLTITKMIKQLPGVYGLSERRLWDHAKSNRILGLHYDKDTGTWHIEGDPPSFTGPLPSEIKFFLKPGSVTEFSVSLAPDSPVSSRIWICSGETEKYIPLRADISGALVTMNWVRAI